MLNTKTRIHQNFSLWKVVKISEHKLQQQKTWKSGGKNKAARFTILFISSLIWINDEQKKLKKFLFVFQPVTEQPHNPNLTLFASFIISE